MNQDLPQLNMLNELAFELFESLSDDELAELNVRMATSCAPARVYDFGCDHNGTVEGGVLLARICMSGLGEVSIDTQFSETLPLPAINVQTHSPLLACMGSQYAGWKFSTDDSFAICSGPARLARGKEDLLTTYGLSSRPDRAVGVFESSSLPTIKDTGVFAAECNLNPENIAICVARTSSLPGAIQVIARSIETTLHKLHELEFDLCLIKSGNGRAPLCPDCDDDMKALGWTNDSILYGADVKLTVDADDETLKSIGRRVPSSSSSDFGTPFGKTFKKYEYDFFKIDKMLFSPARVTLESSRSGNSFEFGEIREDIIKNSFGME